MTVSVDDEPMGLDSRIGIEGIDEPDEPGWVDTLPGWTAGGKAHPFSLSQSRAGPAHIA